MICDEKLGTSDNTDWTQTLLDIGYESKNKEEKKKDFEAVRQENNYLVKSDNKYIHKKLHTNPSTICLKYLIHWNWHIVHDAKVYFYTQMLHSAQNAGFFKVIKLGIILL